VNPLEKPINHMLANWQALKPVLVKKMGATALVFIDDNFRKQGFQGDTFEPWTPRQSSKDPQRPILIGKGTAHLRRSPFISYSDAEIVIITSSLPYSRIHNEGGEIAHPEHSAILNFTGQEGKLKLGKVRTIGQQRKIKEIRRATVGAHTGVMPKRQFMGPSPVLTARLKEMIGKELPATFKIIG
jgi:phage gpG-like protein